MNSKEAFSLEQLINFCCDSESRFNGRAWTVLLERYQNYIYKVISNKCRCANINQINLNFSDSVNEIYHEVIVRLCQDNCKALRNFRHRDKERVFRAWLATIANNAAFQYILRHYINQVKTSDIEELQSYTSNLILEVRSQVYEDVVKLLRKPEKRTSNEKLSKSERDISIFTLTVWQGFDLRMLKMIPCLHDITTKHISNARFRSREKLFKNRDLLN